MEAVTIFGYGSLMDPESLKVTAPSAYEIRPVYIKGFKREFCFWDSVGWTETNLDLAGQPMCALDVHEVSDSKAHVNGVAFTISGNELKRLLIREEGYQLITTPFFDFKTNDQLGTCQVFSADKHDGTFDFNGPAQARYLQVCLDGAKQYVEPFYQEFLKTTYIDSNRLTDMPDLLDKKSD